MSKVEPVEIEVQEILAETEKAFLLKIVMENGEEEDHWIPKSQIIDVEEYEVGDEELTMYITEFIARQEGLGE